MNNAAETPSHISRSRAEDATGARVPTELPEGADFRVCEDAPDVWGPGQILRFSGWVGETDALRPLHLFTDREPGNFYLAGSPRIAFRWSGVDGATARPRALYPEITLLDIGSGSAMILLPDHRTVLFRCENCPLPKVVFDGRTVDPAAPTAMATDRFHTAVRELREGGVAYLACAVDADDADAARRRAEAALVVDWQARARASLDFYARLPVPADEPPGEQKQALQKAFSILRGSIQTPVGPFPAPWSTPSFHHRHLNGWDTLFHAFAFLRFRLEQAAQDCLMLLLAQHGDGCVPNPVWPDPDRNERKIIHPPLIAWAVWHGYLRNGDLRPLALAFPRLKAYLGWIERNRDRNGNGIPEPRSDNCSECSKGGETGRDNDPRFDDRPTVDSVDFAGTLGSEYLCMVEIARVLRLGDEARDFEKRHENLRRAVREVLWDADARFAWDRRLDDGQPVYLRTSAPFLLLFGNLLEPEEAEALVETHLLDPDAFWTALPVPSVARDEAVFEPDLFRGGVWMPHNFLIYQGLLNYGMRETAKELARRTVDTLTRSYCRSGTLHEYFDPDDRRSPSDLPRKAASPPHPDPLLHAPIPEFSWTSAVFIEFLFDLHGG